MGDEFTRQRPAQDIQIFYKISNLSAPKKLYVKFLHQISIKFHSETAHDTIKSLNCVVGQIVKKIMLVV